LVQTISREIMFVNPSLKLLREIIEVKSLFVWDRVYLFVI